MMQAIKLPKKKLQMNTSWEKIRKYCGYVIKAGSWVNSGITMALHNVVSGWDGGG